MNEKAELYRKGRSILGKNSGGLITKLLKHCSYIKNGEIFAQKILEIAARKGSPVEYICGILNGEEKKPLKGKRANNKKKIDGVISGLTSNWKVQP